MIAGVSYNGISRHMSILTPFSEPLATLFGGNPCLWWRFGDQVPAPNACVEVLSAEYKPPHYTAYTGPIASSTKAF